MNKSTLVRAVLGLLLYTFLQPALLFISAGTLEWPVAWVYVVILLSAMIGSRLVVWRKNPDTLRERARFAESRDTQPWDRVLVLVVGIFGPMLINIVAGLDYRFGWSGSVPAWLQVLGTLGLVAGYGVAVWAMVVNPFFSAVARIQEERGQVVITTGPYRFVRHPSYAGSLLAGLAFPFMLSTLWALLPTLIFGMGVIIRTRLEDRMLREGLDGYERFSRQVRYRLVPGLW